MWVGQSSGIRRLLYVIGSLTFLCLVMLISYLIALQFGDSKAKETPASSKARTESNFQSGEWTTEKKQGEISLNLIYGYSKKKQKLTAFILEVWHQKQGILAYITIPEDTGYTISKELYQKLSALQPEVPQVMRLSGLYQYLEGGTSFEYGCAVVGELLDVEISDYTALPSKTLKQYFKKNKKGVWKLNEEVQTELGGWQEQPWEEQETFLEEYITELYGEMKTNRTLEERIEDLRFYKKTEVENVAYYRLPGETQNAGYQPNREAMYEELSAILPFKIKD